MTTRIKNIEDARRIAYAVRNVVIAAKGTTQNQCVLCAAIIRAIYPQAIELDGVIPGEWEFGGEHSCVLVDGWIIDAASEQFGLGEIMVCADDEYADEYDSFHRIKSLPSTGDEKFLWLVKSAAAADRKSVV